MVRYGIDDITAGMILGESIYSTDRKLLVAAGFRIKPVHLELLKKRGFSSVMINVEGTEDVTPETIISEHVQGELSLMLGKAAENIKSIIHKPEKTKKRVIDIIKKDKKVLNQIIRSSGAINVINKVVEDIISEPWTTLNLSKMQQAGNQLFEHAINVTVISLCIGRKYRFTAEEMRQLGLGAINYDLGMLAVPGEILKKRGELTKDEKTILQQHTAYGYLMLSDISAIPATSSIVAMSHHEHQDGTGYPRGMKGENRPPVKTLAKSGLIHRFTEIVSVADAYDMFFNGRRHYSRELEPKEVIKKLIEMKGTKLNSEIVKTLVSIVPTYPVGARVRIVNGPLPDIMGGIGVVSRVVPDHLSEPQVIIFESKNHKRIKPVTLDLTKHQGFSIELLK